MPCDADRLDLSRVRTFPLSERENKVRAAQFARIIQPRTSGSEFLEALPDILAGADFRRLVDAIVESRRRGRPVIICMGAHVIKCGLSPWIIELMKRGVITGLALNGAGAVHDVEVALIGETSEDVAGGIAAGRFGMWRETGALLNGAARDALDGDLGLGKAISQRLATASLKRPDLSVLLAGRRLAVPVTVHVAIGTDITHAHADADGAAIGAATHNDFKRFAALLAGLHSGGVLGNLGSAVVLPMIVEKGLSVVRNLGHEIGPFVGFNMDFIQHYRPNLNPVSRARE
ncbi:MAG: hypothetical protein ACE5O2_16520, partial [Armatimonadota bacterium]